MPLTSDPTKPVADLRGVKCKCTPLWQLVIYFCIHICISPSNDYTVVACSNNNQAQLHTHVSVPYWSPENCESKMLLRLQKAILVITFHTHIQLLWWCHHVVPPLSHALTLAVLSAGNTCANNSYKWATILSSCEKIFMDLFCGAAFL